MSRKWADLSYGQWLTCGVISVMLFAASFLPGSISSPLEVFGFIFGVWAVFLVVKEDVWNWPIGIINSAVYIVVFYQARLWGDTGLSAFYVVLGALGWYWWLRGGEDRSELPMTRTPRALMGLCLVAIVIATGGFYWWFTVTKGASPFVDALATSISLAAQFLVTRKHLENWTLWIIVNAIYIPLYSSRGLWLTAVLYAIYLGLAVMGYRAWVAKIDRDSVGRRDDHPAAT